MGGLTRDSGISNLPVGRLTSRVGLALNSNSGLGRLGFGIRLMGEG